MLKIRFQSWEIVNGTVIDELFGGVTRLEYEWLVDKWLKYARL